MNYDEFDQYLLHGEPDRRDKTQNFCLYHVLSLINNPIRIRFEVERMNSPCDFLMVTFCLHFV